MFVMKKKKKGDGHGEKTITVLLWCFCGRAVAAWWWLECLLTTARQASNGLTAQDDTVKSRLHEVQVEMVTREVVGVNIHEVALKKKMLDANAMCM